MCHWCWSKKFVVSADLAPIVGLSAHCLGRYPQETQVKDCKDRKLLAIVWKSLLTDLKLANSLNNFKHKLKDHFFKKLRYMEQDIFAHWRCIRNLNCNFFLVLWNITLLLRWISEKWILWVRYAAMITISHCCWLCGYPSICLRENEEKTK